MHNPMWDLAKTSLLLVSITAVGLAVEGEGRSAATFSNEDCLLCHGDASAEREDGSSVYVDPDTFSGSIHGQVELECVSCHRDLSRLEELPHEDHLAKVQCGSCHEMAQVQYEQGVHALPRQAGERPAATCSDCHGSHHILPSADLASTIHPFHLPETCGKCHRKSKSLDPTLFLLPGEKPSNVYDLYSQSVHARVLREAGLTVTSTCVTCHGSHVIRAVQDPKSPVARRNIPSLCKQCHQGIYAQFVKSVHGKAYLAGIKDVPVCTDCHGEHRIQGPEGAESTVSPEHVARTCSRCHDDMRLDRKYGILAERLSTYSSSFHGIAMKFGMTTVANCASCHGFHNILPSTDPQSSIHPSQLANTCGKCHPGAGQSFAAVKIHQRDAERDNAWAYWIKRFYVSFIAVILGTFLVLISADLFGRARRRKSGGRQYDSRGE